MSTASRADWAALAPWRGIQDKPDWLGDDGIPISAVEGLQAILDELEAGGGGSGTVRWQDITGKPTFGSAAYTNVDQYATAAQGAEADSALQPGDNVSELANDAGYLSGVLSDTFQKGEVSLVMGQQDYPVVFGAPMADVPDIELDYYMTDGSSELFYAGVREDLLDENGFTFRLNSAPVVASGKMKWQARVYP